MGQFMHTFSILARLLTEVHQSTSCFLKILVNIFTVRSNCILIFLLLFLKISHLKETSRVGAHSLFQVVVNVPAHHRLIIFSFLFSEKLSARSLLLFMILLSKLWALCFLSTRIAARGKLPHWPRELYRELRLQPSGQKTWHLRRLPRQPSS